MADTVSSPPLRNDLLDGRGQLTRPWIMHLQSLTTAVNDANSANAAATASAIPVWPTA